MSEHEKSQRGNARRGWLTGAVVEDLEGETPRRRSDGRRKSSEKSLGKESVVKVAVACWCVLYLVLGRGACPAFGSALFVVVVRWRTEMEKEEHRS